MKLRILILAASLAALLSAAPASAAVLLNEPFAYPDKLITNGWAYTHTGGYESSVWEVTSGSLFAKNGEAWTGVPDACPADKDSKPCTYSSVFRAWTDKDFTSKSVSVAAVVTPIRWTDFNATTADHGIKLWSRLQLQGKQDYAADIDAPGGRVYIKKKCAGGTVNGGTYYTLADDQDAAEWAQGSTHTARFAAVTQADGSVLLEVFRDDILSLAAVDNGVGCAPITHGHMGVRSDDAEFRFDDFTVTN